MNLFSGFERTGEALAPRALFARRLATNAGIALGLILVSLVVGMMFYHRLEGLDWVRAFSHAAMILGGMGPYDAPQAKAGAIFEGSYAIYCGLLLIGVTAFILTPIFHRIMHAFNLPDDGSTGGGAAKKPAKPKARRRR